MSIESPPWRLSLFCAWAAYGVVPTAHFVVLNGGLGRWVTEHLNLGLQIITSLPLFQFTSLPAYQFIRLPVYQLTSLPAYQFTRLLIYQLTSLPAYQFTKLPVNQSIFPIFFAAPSCPSSCPGWWPCTPSPGSPSSSTSSRCRRGQSL